MKTYTCEKCGSALERKSDSEFCCAYCGATYQDESLKKAYEELQKNLRKTVRGEIDEAFVQQQEMQLAKARQNLWEAIKAEHISSQKVLDCARDVKKLAPEDYAANFYELINEEKAKKVVKFLDKVDVNSVEGKLWAKEIILFTIKSLKAEYIIPVKDLIERAYKKTDMESYKEISTLLDEEAKKVKEGIYEVSLPRDVFVMYSSANMDKAKEVVYALEESGVECFLALRNLQHGVNAVENYDSALREAMDNCKAVLFLSSKYSRSLTCDVVRKELPYLRTLDQRSGKTHRKPRVEYRLDDEEIPATKRLIRELFDGLEYCGTAEEVVERVGEALLTGFDVEEQQAKKDVKYCKACGTENAKQVRFCGECAGKEFVATYEEYQALQMKKEEEERAQRLAEEARIKAEQDAKRAEEERLKAEEKSQKAKEREAKLAKEKEELLKRQEEEEAKHAKEAKEAKEREEELLREIERLKAAQAKDLAANAAKEKEPAPPVLEEEPETVATEAPKSVSKEEVNPLSVGADDIEGEEVLVPFPGRIKNLLLAQGDVVKKGQPILILEAMKIDNEITAPCDGSIHFIVSPNDCVEADQVVAYVKASKKQLEEWFQLGLNYYNGKNGYSKNYTEAVKWFEKAADQGHARAQYQLGICYNYGYGVPKNYGEAAGWLFLSAQRGYAGAQSYLGIFYEYGRGVPQSYEDAKKWYKKAIEQGDTYAQKAYARCVKAQEDQKIKTEKADSVNKGKKRGKEDSIPKSVKIVTGITITLAVLMIGCALLFDWPWEVWQWILATAGGLIIGVVLFLISSLILVFKVYTLERILAVLVVPINILLLILLKSNYEVVFAGLSVWLSIFILMFAIIRYEEEKKAYTVMRFVFAALSLIGMILGLIFV